MGNSSSSKSFTYGAYYQHPYAAVIQCKQPLSPGPQYQQLWQGPPNQPAQVPCQCQCYNHWAQNPDNKHQRQNQRGPPNRQERETPQIDPIPMMYSQLLSHVVQSSTIAPSDSKSMEFLFPPWYNSNVQCEFHDGVVGNSIEDCKVFQEKVKHMINKRKLSFDGLNMVNGPLPWWVQRLQKALPRASKSIRKDRP